MIAKTPIYSSILTPTQCCIRSFAKAATWGFFRARLSQCKTERICLCERKLFIDEVKDRTRETSSIYVNQLNLIHHGYTVLTLNGNCLKLHYQWPKAHLASNELPVSTPIAQGNSKKNSKKEWERIL